MAENSQKLAIDLIKRSNKILVMPSSPADGDSIGSAISMYIVLKKMGKDVTVVSSEPVPEVYQFLPNYKVIGNKIISNNDFIVTLDLGNAQIETIKSEVENGKVNLIITPKSGSLPQQDLVFNKAKSNYDLIITVDCAELNQLRNFYENNVEMFQQIPVLNIDHHISNTYFGKINLVDIMASSTTELLLSLFEEMAKLENKELIDEDVATLLLTGIITDTGSFQNANTTPKAFSHAAKLISYGARQQEIIQHVYKTKQLSQLKLWGRVLSKIQTDEKDKIVWSTVSQQDFKDTESTEDQTGDIIDELMTNAPGAEVVLLIKEKEDKSISVSIRTTSAAVDANALAENFSGGGHARAAGFRLKDISLRDAEYKVISFVHEYLNDRELSLPPAIEEEKVATPEEKKEPMIDVKDLLQKAKTLEKAAEIMPKLEKEAEEVAKEEPDKKNKKSSNRLRLKRAPVVIEKKEETPKKEEGNSNGIIYKFED